MACYPWWHDRFKHLRGITYSGGYSIIGYSTERYIPVNPEVLRANAEKAAKKAGLIPASGRLALNTYSLARNIQTEAGTQTAEGKIAVGLSTINRATLWKTSVHGVITKNNQAVNRYGPIHNEHKNSPYGRFTSSSKEPTLEDLAIAQFAIDGHAGRGVNDFARGADNQARVSGKSWVQKLATDRSYWIGELPGVNAREIMLYRHMPKMSQTSAPGKGFVAAAIRRVSQYNTGPYSASCVAQRKQQESTQYITLWAYLPTSLFLQ